MKNYYVYPDELYHHGVKGMKWGVRKDPAPDSARAYAHAIKRANSEYKDEKKEIRRNFRNNVKSKGLLNANTIRRKSTKQALNNIENNIIKYGGTKKAEGKYAARTMLAGAGALTVGTALKSKGRTTGNLGMQYVGSFLQGAGGGAIYSGALFGVDAAIRKK